MMCCDTQQAETLPAVHVGDNVLLCGDTAEAAVTVALVLAVYGTVMLLNVDGRYGYASVRGAESIHIA